MVLLKAEEAVVIGSRGTLRATAAVRPDSVSTTASADASLTGKQDCDVVRMYSAASQRHVCSSL